MTQDQEKESIETICEKVTSQKISDGMSLHDVFKIIAETLIKLDEALQKKAEK